jgi:hypothetical protein
MNNREKAIQIVQRLREMGAECKRLLMERESQVTELTISNQKNTTMASEIDRLRVLTSTEFSDKNADSLVQDVQRDLQSVRDAIDVVVHYVKERIDDGTFCIDNASSDAYDIDFELDSMGNQVRATLEPLERSLVEVVRVKKLMEECNKADSLVVLRATSKSVCVHNYAVQTDADERLEELKKEVDDLNRNLISTRDRCKQYKELVRKFTIQLQREKEVPTTTTEEQLHQPLQQQQQQPLQQQQEIVVTTNEESAATRPQPPRKKTAEQKPAEQLPIGNSGYKDIFAQKKKK